MSFEREEEKKGISPERIKGNEKDEPQKKPKRKRRKKKNLTYRVLLPDSEKEEETD